MTSRKSLRNIKNKWRFLKMFKWIVLISITSINLIIGQTNIEGLLNKAEQHYQVNEYKQAKLYYEEY